jgi:hypothetical protein
MKLFDLIETANVIWSGKFTPYLASVAVELTADHKLLRINAKRTYKNANLFIDHKTKCAILNNQIFKLAPKHYSKLFKRIN